MFPSLKGFNLAIDFAIAALAAIAFLSFHPSKGSTSL